MKETKKNTSDLGDLVEQKCILRLMEKDYVVSKPITKARYDLLVDKGGSIKRIQCKKINYRDGVMIFNTYSSNYEKGRGRKQKNYTGEVDIFMAYCFELDKFYWVPIEKVGNSKFSLRHKSCRKSSNCSKDYEF